MSEKMFNARIQHKHDIEANWKKAENFIPKEAELIVYDVDENFKYERIKVGDGVTNVNQLPFINSFTDEAKEKLDKLEVSDWNANEGEPGHVLNRTHWVEGGMVEILPEVTPEAGDDDGDGVNDIFTLPAAIGLVAGETYVIKWNGVEYTSVAEDASADMGTACVAVGSELFTIMDMPEIGIAIISNNDGYDNPVTISIYQKSETIHKLDGKFLPEGVPYTEIVGGGLTDTLTFNGDPQSKEHVLIPDEITAYYIRLCDKYVDRSELIGGTVSVIDFTDEYSSGTYDITEDLLEDASELFGFPSYVAGEFCVALSQPFTMNGLTLSEGIWTICIPNAVYVSEVKAPNAVFNNSGEIIHKLKGKYLPNGTPYIENDGVTETILEETTVSIQSGELYTLLDTYIPLTLGQTYIVNFNGEEYVRTAELLTEGVISIGNYAFNNRDDDPFCICSISGAGGFGSLIACNYSIYTEVTISVKKDYTYIHKIDNRCLPDDIVLQEHMDETIVYELDKQPKLVGMTISGYDNCFDNICYGNGKFVAGRKYTSDNSEVAISTDGMSWKRIPVNFEEYSNLSKIVYNGSKFIVFSEDYAYYSDDGENWNSVRLPDVFSSYEAKRVKVANGKTYVIDNDNSGEVYSNMAVSDDGITWTTIEIPEALWDLPTYALDKYWMHGVPGGFQSTKGQYIVMSSEDGINWTEININGADISEIGYTWIKDKFIRYRNGYSQAMVSYDGINWEKWNVDSVGYNLYPANMAYINNLLFMERYNSKYRVLSISTDGITWSNIDLGNTAINYGSLCYGAGKYVCLGTETTERGTREIIAVSKDAKTWTKCRWMHDGYDITKEYKDISQRADFKQTDPLHPSYIDNLPFYDQNGQTIVYVNDSKFTYDNLPVDSKGFKYFNIFSAEGYNNHIRNLKNGKPYLITFNGVDYSCKCIYEDKSIMLGNVEKIKGTGDINIPFVIKYELADTEYYYNITVYVLEEMDHLGYTIKGNIPKKLDEQYLPDNIQADFAQNNPFELDYIKNRPFYEDGDTIVKMPERFLPDSVGTVKSINGQTPDEDGNVNVCNIDNVAPGQMIRVKSVDENNKPIEWEPVPWGYIAQNSTLLAEIKEGSYSDDVPFTPIIDEEYDVTYGGVVYHVTAKPATDSGNQCVYIGNGSRKFNTEENTGEPWIYFGYVIDGVMVSSGMWMDDTVADNTIFVYQNTEAVHSIPGKLLPEGVPYVEGGMVEVLAECQPVYGDADDGGFAILEPVSATVGDNYIVNWNGVEYTSIALDSTVFNEAMVGGCMIVNDGVNLETGEGAVFFILILPEPDEGVYGVAVALDGTTELTLSIYHNAEVVHKLPGKLLPEGLPYVEYGGLVEILPECQPEYDEEDEMFAVTQTIGDIVAGRKYIVNWNGIDYKTEAAEFTVEGINIIVLGNPGMMGSTYANTGEPFVIMVVPPHMVEPFGCNAAAIPLDGSTELTISIYGENEIIHKLEGKYLPNGTPYIENEGATETILEETTINIQYGDSITVLDTIIPLNIGQTYIVNFNGDEYVCTASLYANGAICIGSSASFGIQGNNEPFALFYSSGVSFIACDYTIYSEVTLSVKKDITSIHKLDPRCLELDFDWIPYLNAIRGEEVFAERTVGPGLYGYSFGSNTPYYFTPNEYYLIEWNHKPYVAKYTAEEEKDHQTLYGSFTTKDFVIESMYDGSEAHGLRIRLDCHSLNDTPTEVTLAIYRLDTDNKLPNAFLNLDWLPTHEKRNHLLSQISAYGSSSLDHDDIYKVQSFGRFNLVKDTKYGMSWGENSYEVVCKEILYNDKKWDCVGNLSLLESSYEDTREPFLLIREPGLFATEMYVFMKTQNIPNYTSFIYDNEIIYNKLPKEYLPDEVIKTPNNATAGDLLMFDGTNWVKYSKADLIAEIIAALPSAEEA